MELRIKYRDRPAVVVHRAAFKDKKLVYVGRANKRYRYPWGREGVVDLYWIFILDSQHRFVDLQLAKMSNEWKRNESWGE